MNFVDVFHTDSRPAYCGLVLLLMCMLLCDHHLRVEYRFDTYVPLVFDGPPKHELSKISVPRIEILSVLRIKVSIHCSRFKTFTTYPVQCTIGLRFEYLKRFRCEIATSCGDADSNRGLNVHNEFGTSLPIILGAHCRFI